VDTSNGPLAWSTTNLVVKAEPGSVSAKFIFKVKNVSATEVVVNEVKASCGCTIPKMPSRPWKIAPKERSQFEVLVDLRGKTGTLYKDLGVFAANFTNVLGLEVHIPEGSTNGMSTAMADRLWGQQRAAADHQAVFKDECVKCHLEPAFGKSGEQLFHVSCGICHEAKHRATMVPDLATLKTGIDADYWRRWVTYGKAGTLMPGFAATQGGPLDDSQINSLVGYLTNAFPRPVRK
jgi:cytochrome c553